MKKTFAAALAVALTMLLSGCFRMHVNLTLEENDMASGSVVFAVSDKAAEQLQMTPQAMFDAILEQSGGADSMAPEGSTQSDYAQDGYTGYEWTFKSEPISEASGMDEIKIERDGDDYVVTGTLDMGDEADATSAQLMESSDIAINITFPGEVKEANGEINGNTVTWKAAATGSTEINARGSAIAGSSTPNWLMIVGIIVGALVIAGVIAAIIMSRNSRKKAGVGADGPSYAIPGQYPAADAQQGYHAPGQATQGQFAQGQPAQGYQAPGQAAQGYQTAGNETAGYQAPGSQQYTAPGQAAPVAQPDQARYAPHDAPTDSQTGTPTQPAAASGPAGSSEIGQEPTQPNPTNAPAENPTTNANYPLPPADPENPENPQQ